MRAAATAADRHAGLPDAAAEAGTGGLRRRTRLGRIDAAAVLRRRGEAYLAIRADAAALAVAGEPARIGRVLLARHRGAEVLRATAQLDRAAAEGVDDRQVLRQLGGT